MSNCLAPDPILQPTLSDDDQGASPQSGTHPRTIDWKGTVALAMGGCNQSLFLIGALIAGQGSIPGQGSAGVPLLMIGLLLSWMATPGWTELILLYPNRVGGIASCCAEAFRPISPVLANLAGVCYWWGWIPTCGLTALLSASAIHMWYLPHVPIPLLACALVTAFSALNLMGVQWVTRFVIPLATASALLAFVSGIAPVLAGHVEWHRATNWDLAVPFQGVFGKVTSAMAGLYLVGFAAPAFEAAACHVGETKDPNKNVPKAMFISAGMASLYFVLLPVVWLGALGADALAGDLQTTLGPTFAPVVGSAAKAVAIWFMMLNMFHGTIQPLAGASRTLMQLSEDALLPRALAKRTKTDAPALATLLTALVAIIFLLIGDPLWMIAAANLCYLIGICLPNIAVWLLRKDMPQLRRPYRAPKYTIRLGVIAACVWAMSAVLGFEQYGLPTALAGLAMAYSGSIFYAWRRWSDGRRQKTRLAVNRSIHTKLTGAMVVVLVLDGAGYLLAIAHVSKHETALTAGLQDIFVAVALLTISVGLVLPGMISHAAEQVARRADNLATGVLAELTSAMEALGEGDLARAHASVDLEPLPVSSHDELGAMARSFNTMQDQIARAAVALEQAGAGLNEARCALTQSNERFELAVRGSRDGLWDWNIATGAMYYSPQWKAMLGYADDELPNVSETWRSLLHPDDLPNVLDHLGLYQASDETVYEHEYRMRHKDGSYRWILARAETLRDADNHPYRMSGSHTDITERKHALREAQDRADRDSLTGLWNHRTFHKCLGEEAARALRDGSRFAVVMLDLNNFKFFNDTHGHLVGDGVLRQVAARLQEVCRPGDVVSRFGGDEFALLLMDVGSATATEIESRLLSSLDALWYISEDGQTIIPLSLSVGADLFPESGSDWHDAVRQADERLMRAKTGGSDEAGVDQIRVDVRRQVAGFSMLEALVAAVDNKDRYTRRHSEDVLAYSLMIARELGMDEAMQQTVAVAALVHDVGKIGVPDAILRKPGKLTAAEFAAIKQHPQMGAIMVGALPGLEGTLDAVRHHHERWDGGGYPYGLREGETPLIARLMAVADAFSAMTTDRPYRKGMERDQAVKILRAGAGSQWDPHCVEAFLKAQGADQGTTQTVELNIPDELPLAA